MQDLRQRVSFHQILICLNNVINAIVDKYYKKLSTGMFINSFQF
jgi:hypothetical protein